MFMVGERKAGGSKGCLFGTVRWSASSSEAKSRAIRFLAVDYRPGRLIRRLTSSRQARSRAIHSARRLAGSKQAGSTPTRSERRLASSRQARCVLRVRRRRGRGQFAQGSIALEVEVVEGDSLNIRWAGGRKNCGASERGREGTRGRKKERMTVWALQSSVFAQMRRQSVTHPSIFAVRSLSKSKTRRRRAGESVLGREADTIGRPTQPPELQNSKPVTRRRRQDRSSGQAGASVGGRVANIIICMMRMSWRRRWARWSVKWTVSRFRADDAMTEGHPKTVVARWGEEVG